MAERIQQRLTWRASHSTKSGNRWVARFALTAISLTLIASFLYFLLRARPDPQLRTFLIHAGSFDQRAILPPMFGTNAAARIRDQLGATEIRGVAKSIHEAIGETENFRVLLDDPDDTLLIIVRGYLLEDSDGSAMIACSDLGPIMDQGDPDGNQPVAEGLLPLDDLLKFVATEMPPSFNGSRVIVLDVEPLAALPRFGQFGDTVFGGVDRTLRNLSSERADRIWVLATRGPLQNAGWDPASKLPLSTQSLLEAIGGKADFDDDREIHLDEICRYLSARYKRLSKGSGKPPVEVMLLRGGEGRINDVTAAENVWLAKVVADTSGQPEDEQNGTENDAGGEPSSSDEEHDATAARQPLHVTMVRFPQDTANPPAADANASTSGTSSDPKNGGESVDERPGTGDDPAASADVVVPEDGIWDVRDRLESAAIDRSGLLHPIVVAPHLWRKFLADSLHAEIEELDAPSDSVQLAKDSLVAIEQAIGSESANGDRVADPTAKKILELWTSTQRQRRGQERDERVRTADHLQAAVAIGRTRMWSFSLYQRESFIGGSAPIGDQQDLLRAVEKGESWLGEQRSTEAEERAASARILDAIGESSSLVQRNVDDLLDKFDRIEPGQAWGPIREAYAWLRSPLPTGKQRHALLAAMTEQQMQLDHAEKDVLAADASSISLANLANDRSAEEIESLVGRLEPAVWARLAGEVRDASSFATAFLASGKVDPRDVTIEFSRPLVHSIKPVPKQREPSIRLFDSSGFVIAGNRIAFRSLRESVDVQIDPDSSQTTEFELRVVPEGFADGQSQKVHFKWKTDSRVRPGKNDKTVRIKIAPNESFRVRLEIESLPQRFKQRASFPLVIAVVPKTDDPDLKSLDQRLRLSLILPKPDRVGVKVHTVGLKKGSSDGPPGGLWLRTFASRKTQFSFSLFNQSHKKCRARVWLIRLTDPFVEQSIDGYWPEVLAEPARVMAMKMLVFNEDKRRVYQSVLDDQLLKGPVDVTLDNVPVKLSWNKPEPEPDESSGDQPPSEQVKVSTPGSGTNVSHGMAFVIRLIDDAGVPLKSKDELIWLVPNPRSPESYVSLNVTYDQGDVLVSAAIKKRIDGDDQDDKIPEITDRPIRLAWHECDQWEGFQRNMTDEPRSQTVDVVPGKSSDSIAVRVADKGETIVQIDVDGWPRAIRKKIAHDPNAKARAAPRQDEIEFSLIRIDYGKKEPVIRKNQRDHLPLGPPTVFFPEPNKKVVFRGRGKTLLTRLRADVTAVFYRNKRPPEIRLAEGQRTLRRFWTDRSIETRIDELTDDGDLTLTTTVGDLDTHWNAIAQSADKQVALTAGLQVTDLDGNQKQAITSINLILDSTPPEVDQFRPSQANRYLVGRSYEWTIQCSDPNKYGAASGISKIVFGLDNDRDGKPDDDRFRSHTFDDPNAEPEVPRSLRQLGTKDTGTHNFVVQVWDAAGLASEPRTEMITVQNPVKKKAKKAKPPVAKMAAGKTPATATPAPAPKPKPKPKFGNIVGKITTGSTLRGKLTLTPAPKKMRPAGGVIDVGSANPRFAFRNLPEGEYTLSFKGTASGSSKAYTWSGLLIDNAGGEPSLSLNPQN